jgi:hypothetical protein
LRARVRTSSQKERTHRERNTTHTHRGFCAGVYLNQREKKKKKKKTTFFSFGKNHHFAAEREKGRSRDLSLVHERVLSP